jgi:hypothetical protein
MIAIKSTTQEVFSITTDRCQAGTSRAPGQISLLVNRVHRSFDHGGIENPLQTSQTLVLEYELDFTDALEIKKQKKNLS